MRVSRLLLKHFRCFEEQEFLFDAPVVLIRGRNGSGKTTMLEALYYACYLRSFRTYSPQELITFNQSSFFIGLSLQEDQISKDIAIGISRKKRSVKINQHQVTTFKELIENFRVITITEYDLGLIHESPDVRRVFVDQAIMLHDPDYAQIVRTYRQTLYHRNALLTQQVVDENLYRVWTDQLFLQSAHIKKQRIDYLVVLAQHVNHLLSTFISSDLSITLDYRVKHGLDLLTTNDLRSCTAPIEQQERVLGRTRYGAHLDDIQINFGGKSSRHFASRGQQKLAVLLIKIAQLKHLINDRSPNTIILLLDDFMTDFDQEIATRLITMLLELSIQLIFTSPVKRGGIESFFSSKGEIQHISLSN